jgi:hypothetical protein
MNLRNTVTVAVLCLLLFCLATLHAADAPTAKLSPVNGLTDDEATKCIGGYLWTLDVTVPHGAKQVQATLALAPKGKDAAPFAAGVKAPLTANTQLRLLVAVVPLGRDIRECDEVRVTVIGFGNWSSTVEKNPFRGSKGVGRPAAPEDAGAGKYHLMGSFSRDALPSPLSGCDQVLSLRIGTE